MYRKCPMTATLLVTAPLVPLTTVEEADLNKWLDWLNGEWETAILDPKSPESQSLAAMEATWLAKQEYYRDQFLYADRL